MSVHTILIVDDEANQRIMLEYALQSPDHWMIITAADAFEALARVDEQTPDLIITDYNMHTMNGIQLVEELRARGIDSRVILMTAYSSAALREAAQLLDVDHYLTKPVPLKLIRHLTAAMMASAL